jgi:nicotinate-nucleotide adenylyltransferase
MKKIAIYGGTFNPLHNGHVVALQTIIDSELFDEVHLMPSGVPPFKQDEAGTLIHRLEMSKIVCDNLKGIILNREEVDSENLSYTYDTFISLNNRYPNTKHYWTIGYDNLYNVETWYRGEDLLSSLGFIILNRGGYDKQDAMEKMNEFTTKYGTEFIQLDMPNIEISSSDVRLRVKNGKSIYGFVPDSISSYIQQNDLYI